MAKKDKDVIYVKMPSRLNWMTTFCDMLTILLCFFVLIISMSSMESKALKNTFGFFNSVVGPLEFPQQHEVMVAQPIVKVAPNIIQLDAGNLHRSLIISLKKLNAGFQPAIAYSVANHGPITGSRTKLRVNFLRVLEQKKKLHLSDSLHKVIYSYEFFRDPCRDRFLRFRATDDTHSPDSTFDRTAPNRYLDPYGEKYFEEGKIQSTLKLLQSKREEIFNEIFVGFRFSFGAKNTHMLPEMRISPSFEKGAGLIIAF